MCSSHLFRHWRLQLPFGARALIHVVIAMVASLVFETIYNKIKFITQNQSDLVLPEFTAYLSHSTSPNGSSAVAERWCSVWHHRC